MGKIISARLATDDYDPMNLLGSSDIFSPKKYISKEKFTSKIKKNKLNKKNKKRSK